MIDGIPVGGATVAEARVTILKERVAPRIKTFRLTLNGRGTNISPQAAGYKVNITATIAKALRYGRQTPMKEATVNVPLMHTVDQKKLRRVLEVGPRSSTSAPAAHG